jgi:hypothetical protein
MITFKKENSTIEIQAAYVADFCSAEHFLHLDQAILLKSDNFKSPMAGNIAGFASQDSAAVYRARYVAGDVSWAELIR